MSDLKDQMPKQNLSNEPSKTAWTIQQSSELYGVTKWGGGYFRVNRQGHVSVCPQGEKGYEIDLYQLVNELIDRGIRSPMLIRFTDIIQSRIELLAGCFSRAIDECKYQGKYFGVYPIKVNQQRHLVKELVRLGRDHRLGLECGSKSELLVVLSHMNNPNAVIICNGFKDTEYIETAILSQKMGRHTIIVIERMDELPIILEAAKKFQTKPKIGLRSKLGTKSSGRWGKSSGATSKFGLSSSELVNCIDVLIQEDLLPCLELFHFHIGSQIPNIQALKAALKEGARFYVELFKMGAQIRYVDVGGGLGVDYDGSGISDSSTNYDEQEYANDVVSILQSHCDEKGIPHPNIITESGRSIVAHHSVLVFNILGRTNLTHLDAPPIVEKEDHSILRDLREMHDNLSKKNIHEFYNDLMQIREDVLQLFTFGVLNLRQRAKAEEFFWRIAFAMKDLARMTEEAEEISVGVEQLLSETYFCNFSVFQSAPDLWAVDQRFPILPIHKLDEKPELRAKLADITCDSDGVIESFIDVETGDTRATLPVHPISKSTPYYIGIFLIGAYQEILGDLHNLFGDTDAVHITIRPNGYHIDHLVEGDSVAEVLSYVEYDKSEIIENIRLACEKSILEGTMTKPEAKLLMRNFEAGLSGYTYLEEPE